MRTPLLLGCLLVVLTGCGSISRLATARIEITAGTNRVVVTQPKDTVFKKLSYDPSTGAIEVTGYASAANAAAIAAQQAQTEAITSAVTGAMASAQASAEKMLNAYMGRPGAFAAPSAPAAVPQARSIAPPTEQTLIHPLYQGNGLATTLPNIIPGYTPMPNNFTNWATPAQNITPNHSLTITPRVPTPDARATDAVAKPPPAE
jgi:hypothetical protein